MVTSNIPAGLPGEAELEALAGALFTDFEPDVCAAGIADLLATGNTAVADRAVQKASRLGGVAASYAAQAEAASGSSAGYAAQGAALAQQAVPLAEAAGGAVSPQVVAAGAGAVPATAGGGVPAASALESSYARLARYAEEAAGLTAEGMGAVPLASNGAPAVPGGLNGFGADGVGAGNLLASAAPASPGQGFQRLAQYAEEAAGRAPEAAPYVAQAAALVPGANLLEPGIPATLTGFGIPESGIPVSAPAAFAPQASLAGGEAASYAPVVLSEAQAKDYAAGLPAAHVSAAPEPQKERRQFHDDGNVIIGTKTLAQIRADFPILRERVHGYPLVWLDNGATTQRPRAVIDRLSYYYEHENSNVHRGAHELAARSTDAYEGARKTVAEFLGAPDSDGVVFVRGTTEGINLVAHAYVKQYLRPGDEIIVSYLEHHANIVPWQLVAQETGAVLKVIPVDATGQLLLGEYSRLFTSRTKFVAVTHVSNALGTVTPVAELVGIAHAHGVRILIDGAQSVAHIPINLAALDADFFVFSGHKIYGPTGIGAVYGKKDAWEAARPYHGGGNMIKDVTFERTIYNAVPNKFEAGTGSIADAVGLGAALEYLQGIGMAAVSAHEHNLLAYAMREMRAVPGLRLIGTAADKASVLSFVLDGVDNEAVGARLNELGIAVRTGHHCAQPILRHFGLEGTVRPTLALYNSFNDVDALVAGIRTLV